MAGEGFIQNAINSLKGNRNHLYRKHIFKGEKQFLNKNTSDFKSSKRKIKLKKFSKEEIENFQEKYRIVQSKEKIFNRIGIVSLFAFCILGVSSIFYWNNQTEKRIESKRSKFIEIEKTNQYILFIEEGDTWIEKEHYNNAIYKYKQALKIYPKKYEVNYRLLLAYSYSCTYKKKYCNEGQNLYRKVLENNPQKKELLELRKYFEN